MDNLPSWFQDYCELIEEGFSQRQAAIVLDIPRTTIQGMLKRINASLVKEDVEQSIPQNVVRNSPRITFIDLENSPTIAAVWGRYNQNVNQAGVVSESFILSASWKFSDSSNVHAVVLDDKDDIIAGNDYKILETLWHVLNNSDIVIAHNGRKFDIPVIKARMIAMGFPPLKSFRIIDTLDIAKQFKFPSNKLDSIGLYLGVGRKLPHTGMSLWMDFLKGDVQAIHTMVEYNKQDVLLLEAVYYKLRAWDAKHPLVNNYHNDNELRCPCCGSENVFHTDQLVYTQIGVYNEYVCNDCGKRSKLLEDNNRTEKKKSLLRN